MEAAPTICPKCHKPAWAPYLMRATKKYGQVYTYEVYRHPDGRRHTSKKCTWNRRGNFVLGFVFTIFSFYGLATLLSSQTFTTAPCALLIRCDYGRTCPDLLVRV